MIPNQLLFYKLSDNYVNYMYSIDSKVQRNANDTTIPRPYIGILLHMNGHDYYAPLSSYKSTYKKKKAWFAKVYNGTDPEPVAILKYNCMIPVRKEFLEYIDFSKQYPKYRDLLESEYQYLKANRSTILEQAKSVYDKVTVQKNSYLVETCVNFKKLEANYLKFQTK